MSFLVQSKIGLLKLLKFNFTSIALILLQLVHCERIGNSLHLYVFADHICYVWWQWLIIVVCFPILVMFPLSFGMAIDRLKERKISVNAFLISCVLPFSFYFSKEIPEHPEAEKEEEQCRNAILDIEEELFDVESKGIRWPVVQLYRMLVIILVDTIVLNPIFKTLWFIAIFPLFAFHDGYRKPFQNHFLNHLQRLTSTCLFLVTACNIPSAFSSVGDISKVPNMDICLTILRFLELSLCLLVILSFPCWKIWGKYKERFYRRKKNN